MKKACACRRKVAYVPLATLILMVLFVPRISPQCVGDDQNVMSSGFAIVPENGARISNHIVTFGWYRAKDAGEYLLQVDNNIDFGSPEIEVSTRDVFFTSNLLSDDTYYWRVKVLSVNDETLWLWKGVAQFTVSTSFPTGGAVKDLGVPHLQQHKDTRMLCLSGGPHTGKHAWDVDHISRGDIACDHCDWYCVRAGIAMINRYYGGSISQDRISYYLLGGGPPEDDLGHGRGLYPGETADGLMWALKGASITHVNGKPTFGQIKTWIDTNRPILRRNVAGTWHATVIDGYEENGGQSVHVIDPWTGTENTYAYGGLAIYQVWIPAAGATARSDEASISRDSDGDGIVNFDEKKRFKTHLRNADTDGDGALDKSEITYYTFTALDPDPDADGVRMELDPDEVQPMRAAPMAVGDFDLDGYDDLAIGVQGEGVGGDADAGCVNVLYGSSTGLTATGNQMWHQGVSGVQGAVEKGDMFGASLAVGDFDLDGYDDLAIGVPGEDIGDIVDAGCVNVLYGSSTGLTATGNQMWHQKNAAIVGVAEDYDMFGASLVVGDFDLDGYDDLAIGVSGEAVGTKYGAGCVNVLYGTSTGLLTTGNQMWHSDVSGVRGASGPWDNFGASLAVGDFDLDGYDDLAIGVPGENIATKRDAGCVNVLYGFHATGLTATGDQRWHQNTAGVVGGSEKGDRFG